MRLTMAKISIERSNAYINRFRDIHIFIDGEKVGSLANGESADYTTTAGQHEVVAKIDWCRSPKISVDLSEDETKTLRIGGFKYSNYIVALAAGLLLVHFLLSRSIGFHYGLYPAVALMIIFAYYLSLGRSSYLSLEEM